MGLLRMLLCFLFLLLLDSEVMAYSAAGDGTEHGMVMRDMAGYRADDGAFQAAFGFSR
jgi:hypothetical protein